MDEPVPRSYFIHFLNPEILEFHGHSAANDFYAVHTREISRLLKFALLFSSGPLLFSTKYLLERGFFGSIMKELSVVIAANEMQFVGGFASAEEMEEIKGREYRDSPSKYSSPVNASTFRSVASIVTWRPRVRRATVDDIISDWTEGILWKRHATWKCAISDIASQNRSSINVIETDLVEVANRLEGRAFILETVDALTRVNLSGTSRVRLNYEINRAYILSYLREYGAAVLAETPLCASAFDIPRYSGGEGIGYVSWYDAVSLLRQVGLLCIGDGSISWTMLLRLKYLPAFATVREAILAATIRQSASPYHRLGRKRVNKWHNHPPSARCQEALFARIEEIAGSLHSEVDDVNDWRTEDERTGLNPLAGGLPNFSSLRANRSPTRCGANEPGISPPSSTPPRVFISYSHDSELHANRVRHLSDRLRLDGIDCRIDQYIMNPAEGWPLWVDNQIDEADFVLVLFTERYAKRSLEPSRSGVRYESVLMLQDLHEAGMINNKFIPVLFDGADSKHIVKWLKPFNQYSIACDAGYDLLCRRLLNDPAVEMPPLGIFRRKGPAIR